VFDHSSGGEQVNGRVQHVIEALEAFVPAEDDGETTGRLYEIFDGFREQPGREAAMSAIFGVIERFPDAELGTPGPLVHELEAMAGYEKELRNSIGRQPAPLSIWMVNRILNTTMSWDTREGWLSLLRSVLIHPKADELSRQEAMDFLAHQDQRPCGNA
jgi:hypothetical protein